VALLFALPAMLAVLTTRSLIVPSIPDPIAGMSKDILIMFLFAALMISAAVFMLRPLKVKNRLAPKLTAIHAIKLASGSAGVGFLTGLVSDYSNTDCTF
jgi:hypothetical protein